MIKVKCNKGGLDNLISSVERVKQSVEDIYSSIESDVQQVNNEALHSINKAMQGINKTIIDKEGNEQTNPDYLKYEEALTTAGENDKKIDNALKSKTNITTKLENALKGLNMIKEAITRFESDTGNVEFSVATGTTVTNSATGESVTQITFDVTFPDGTTKKFTIGELLNAFYATTEFQMYGVYQTALLKEEYGLGELTDEEIRHVLETSRSVTNFAFDLGLYKISTEESLDGYKQNLKEAGFKITEEAKSILDGVDFGNDEDRQAALKFLGGSTGSDLFKGAASAAILGLFGYYNNRSDLEAKDKALADASETDATGSSAYSAGASVGGSFSGGYSGGSSGGSGGSGGTKSKNKKSKSKSKSKTKVDNTQEKTDTTNTTEKPTETSTEAPTPGTVTPTEGSTIPLVSPTDTSGLPTEINAETDKDYDALARAEYEAKGQDAISEERAELTKKANELFDKEDKTKLMKVLSDYGYSEKDIPKIIQDRDLTVSAILIGDRKKQLAEKANELAARDKIESFNTTYDDNITYDSLKDGSGARLLANRSADSGIRNAEKELSTAESKYVTAATTATAAIKSLNEAKAEMAAAKEGIGNGIKSDPSTWDEKSLTEYNKEVSELYNRKVSEVGNKAGSWTSEDWEKVNNAKANKEAELAYDKGKDLSKWTDQDKSTYETKIDQIKEDYIKKYGKETSKWSNDVQDSYKKDADNAYKNIAIEVGKKQLTSEDRQTISEAETNMRNSIASEKGNQSNWSEADTKSYQEELEAIKAKYSGTINTDNTSAKWSDSQVRTYNSAVEKYNKAVEDVQNKIIKAKEAEAEYKAKKQAVTLAENEFYEKNDALNKKTAEESQLRTDGNNNVMITSEKLTGKVDVNNMLEFDSNGARLVDKASTANNSGAENQVVDE